MPKACAARRQWSSVIMIRALGRLPPGFMCAARSKRSACMRRVMAGELRPVLCGSSSRCGACADAVLVGRRAHFTAQGSMNSRPLDSPWARARLDRSGQTRQGHTLKTGPKHGFGATGMRPVRFREAGAPLEGCSQRVVSRILRPPRWCPIGLSRCLRRSIRCRLRRTLRLTVRNRGFKPLFKAGQA